jgi:F-type H+-transporting ATPase subunit delta
VNVRRLVQGFARTVAATSDDHLGEALVVLRDIARSARLPEMVAVLNSPRVEEAAKIEAVKSLSSRPVSGAEEQVLALAVRGRMVPYLAEVADEAERIGDRARNIQLVQVTSAMALDEQQQARLSGAVSRSMGFQAKLAVTVDPAEGAGVRLKIGSVVLDNTLRARLDQIGETLRSVSRE